MWQKISRILKKITQIWHVSTLSQDTHRVLVILIDSTIFLLCFHSGFPWHTLDDRSLVGVSSIDFKLMKIWVLRLLVGDTSNVHFDMIPSSLGISIDGIEYNTNAKQCTCAQCTWLDKQIQLKMWKCYENLSVKLVWQIKI